MTYVGLFGGPGFMYLEPYRVCRSLCTAVVRTFLLIDSEMPWAISVSVIHIYMYIYINDIYIYIYTLRVQSTQIWSGFCIRNRKYCLGYIFHSWALGSLKIYVYIYISLSLSTQHPRHQIRFLIEMPHRFPRYPATVNSS